MKKLIYLSMILVAMVVVTSCEEEEITKTDDVNGINDGLMTLANLHGRWFFQSYLYDDILWTEESTIPNEYDDIDDMFNVDWFFDTETMHAYMSENGYGYVINKYGNIITLSDNVNVVFRFRVLYYDYNTMKLEWEDSGTFIDNYKGGIFTYVRE